MFDWVTNTLLHFSYLSSIIWCGVDAAKDIVAVSITKPANNRKFLHLRSHFPALAFVKLACLYSNLLVLWGVTHVQLPNTLAWNEKRYFAIMLSAIIWNLNYLLFYSLTLFSSLWTVWQPAKHGEWYVKPLTPQIGKYDSLEQLQFWLQLDNNNGFSNLKTKGVLRNFTKFKGKQLCQSLFFNKVAA